jgi:hypothetical protein
MKLDKKENSTLKETDTIKFTSTDLDSFSLAVSYKESDGGYTGSYFKSIGKTATIKVQDIINHYSKESIDLHGKGIKVTIFSTKYGEFTDKYKLEVTYKIEK